MFDLVLLILMGMAVGFGATVWTIAMLAVRHVSRWHFVWYLVLVVSHIGVGVLLIIRIQGIDVPRLPIILSLIPVFVIPAVIHLLGITQTRSIIYDKIEPPNE